MRTWVLLIFSALLCACTTTPSSDTIDGILNVPENRKNANSRTVNLVYKVLRAKNVNSRKAPILFLQGGPGGATLFMEKFWKNHPLRNDRDIVLMDQRGTGASEANCKDLGNAFIAILRQDLDQEGEYKALRSILSDCKKTIEDKGVDLAGYKSKEIAADFEDLRKDLGYDKWNLFGGSYGSRLGLTIMRDFPKSVRSAVLTSIFAPESNLYKGSIQNFENSLYSVLERCKKSKSCNSRYPDLKTRLSKSLKKLQTEPLRFPYKGKPFVLNSEDALLLLQQALYSRHTIANIPSLIDAFENDKIEPLIIAIEQFSLAVNTINIPMSLSVIAYEEIPFNDDTDFDRYLKQQSEIGIRSAIVGSSAKISADWHSYRASDFENQAVVSEIPTLMASGGLDPVTPTSNAEESLKHLKNGYGIIFPDESHNILNPCFFEITKNFLNNPFHKPDLECSSKRKAIEWNILKAAQ